MFSLEVKAYSEAASFFFVVRLAFGFSVATASVTGAAGLEVTLFRRAFIFLRLRDTPYDPIEIFPFLDFLSPLPMF